MFYKKTVIMVSVDGGKEKAILGATVNGGTTSGSVKLYNCKEQHGILILTFLVGGIVEKCGLNWRKNDEYSFEVDKEIDLDNAICAVVGVTAGNAKPVVIGSCKQTKPTNVEVRLATCVQEMGEEPLTVEKVEEVLDENQIDYDLEEQEIIENAIDEELQKDECDHACSHCKYREAFYEKPPLEEKEPQINSTYYSEVSDQIKELFSTCEPESFLESIIPSSKWVKVDYEKDGNYYVVGLIYENEELRFVCYGVPGYYASDSPKELEGICKWVPADSSKPFEFGYWLTYQDAQTGDNVDVEII